MQQTVVKIDLCRSKAFAGLHETKDPKIRTDTLKRLIEVAQPCFPESTKSYPEGSFYKADGDALYYLLDKPTVALRGAIEFMQLWFHEVPSLPDCRVFLDRSTIDTLEVAGRIELTGPAFENISVVEKGRQEGQIYLTNNLLESIDTTMARFVFLENVSPRQGSKLELYSAAFDDPRTVGDTSLVHALFVAHPKAAEARDRLFELFLIEYLLDKETIKSLADFVSWAEAKQYSLPARSDLERLLKNSPSFENRGGHWFLSATARSELNAARTEYRTARDRCVDTIVKFLVETTRRSDAPAGLAIAEMAEEYLSSMFAEVRMMANYFRSTLQLFDSPPDLFDRFDYILGRRLDRERLSYYQEFRRGFILGLRQAAAEANLFIAAVFHNVLATYYLNRSRQASQYQVDRLRERAIYLDTNVLYSFMVEASPFHEISAYFIERLGKLGIRARVLLISLWEYEQALRFVERNYDEKGAREPIIRRNPWLYQQFMLERPRYLNSMAVCREAYSIAKDLQVEATNCAELDSRLRSRGLELEKDAVDLSQKEADEEWVEHRNWMTSNRWDLSEYWEFMNKEFPASVRLHDMTCVATMASKAAAFKDDALGPKVMFLTLDGKLLRLRKRYAFMCSPIQFLEFILPYLFLSDIPLTDATEFPNRLLSAQLGTLLVKRPPEMTEIIKAYFREPSIAAEDPRKMVADISEDMARVLSGQRLHQLVTESAQLTPEQREELSRQTVASFEELEQLRNRVDTDSKRADQLQSELEKRETTIARLNRTLAYWKSQAKRK